MLEIGMMDLGLLIGEGELAGEMALLLASTPKISEFLKRSPLQGKLLKKRIQTWSEQLGEEMRHKPVPVALEQEYLLYQAHRLLPLPELVGRLPALLEALEQHSPFAGDARSLVRQIMVQPTEGLRQLFVEKWRASLVGSLLQLQQQIAELRFQPGVVLALDRIGDLIGLLQGVGHYGLEALLEIPGAAPVRGAQLSHDVEQLREVVTLGHERVASLRSKG